ncbi:MAG: general secretion pathway protein B [Candidatus Azotimanducaceae bacterium]|jgi:general secretion pathway protein B
MSYILEALNKSEQERRGGQTPDLNTVHRPPPGQTVRSTPWLAIVVVFGLLNGIALTYWFMSSPPAESGAQIAADTPVSTAAEISAAGQPKPALTALAESTPKAPDTDVITPNSVPNLGLQAPVRITELPINVQRQIPNLVFSSHLYSDDAGFRMVNINNKMIREGDMVANDLELLEITEGGVVLGYLHYVFEVSVLRDWSFN